MPKSVLGVTRITGYRRNSGGENEYIEIDHADIFVNYEIFQFTLDDSWGYSLQSLVLHEVGHLLGLDHDFSSSEETVMYPYLSRHTKHHFPTTRDIAAIKTKYGVGSLAANPSIEDDNEVRDKVILIHEIRPDGCDRV